MEKEYNKNEINHITILRNISIILVILGHAGCIYAGYWSYTVVNGNSSILKFITEYIYSFHMPLFVFISGYIYIYNKEKRNKYKSFIELIINKAKRLLIPYLVSGVVFMIPIQMLFNVYKDKQSFLERVVNGILIAKNPAHLWYLLMLFNLFLIFYFIEKFIDMKKYIVNFIIFFIWDIRHINLLKIKKVLKFLKN